MCNIVIQMRPKPWTRQSLHLAHSSEQQGGHGVTSPLDDLAIKCRLPLLQLLRIGVTIEHNSMVERVARDVGGCQAPMPSETIRYRSRQRPRAGRIKDKR